MLYDVIGTCTLLRLDGCGNGPSGAHGAQFGRIVGDPSPYDSLVPLGSVEDVEDDHRAKSIGLEPTTYGVSRFGCYQCGAPTC